MKHTIKYLASGPFGLHTMTAILEIDAQSATTKSIIDALMHDALMKGYNAIIGYESIDGNKTATMVLHGDLREHEAVCREVFRLLGQIASCKSELERLEDKTGARGAFLTRVVRENEVALDAMHKALALVGVDVDDNRGKRQILTNLGFYRTTL